LKNINEKIQKINDLQEGDIDALCELDSMGLLLAPGEEFSKYKKRLQNLFGHLEEIYSELDKNGKVTVFDCVELDKERAIPPEIMAEAAEIDNKFYGFKIDWVPGFFLSKSLGFLWGGCAISFPEDFLSVFLIRGVFAKKKKWLFYRRDELLSHELCHVARLPIEERSFEELFAYRMSPSGFRRYMGNCFQYQIDAILFIVPFFLLLGAQACQQFLKLNWLPIYPFWILAGAYPLFLLIRNQLIRNRFFRAKQKLENEGFKQVLPILFRSNKDEIHEIGAQADGLSLFCHFFQDFP